MYGLSGGMSAQDVRAKMESMGYAGRWGNLLASIHTVIKRLHQKGEIQATGNVNGRDTYRWAEKQANAFANVFAERMRTVPPPPGVEGIYGGTETATEDNQPGRKPVDFKPKYGTPDPLNQRGKK